MTKKIALIILTVLSIAVLTGCNTIHGVGNDIESGGKAIQKVTGR